MSEPVTLTNCDREPIHIPGAIQPHGCLVVLRASDLVVEQLSANAVAFLGGAAPAATLEALFAADSVGALRSAAAAPGQHRERNPIEVTGRDGRPFHAMLHRPSAPEDTLVIELEPRGADATGFHPMLRESLARLQSQGDLVGLCQVAAEEVRRLTGFDRVMVYRFDEEWSGEVLAEARRDDLETFLGLHYPASDIPVQARRLYEKNWLRLIVDVDYVPSPIEPAESPRTGAPLDMSAAVLRSVSPIHCQYLRNMGVRASMSISLMVDGKLWGLIACHHYAGPLVVPFALRESSEFFGQSLSWHVAALVRDGATRRDLQVRSAESAIVDALRTSRSVGEGLCVPALLELVDAQGAVVVFEGERCVVGDVPPPPVVDAVLAWLATRTGESEAVESLAAVVPAATPEVAAGLLALPISRDHGDHILWFRPETERTVDWAGDPRKVGDQSTPDRLSPRGSFALWRETVRGRSLPWVRWQRDAAESLRGSVMVAMRRRAAELKLVNERLVAADRAKDVFIATVSHELRTPLHVIKGWADILGSSSRLTEERVSHAIEVIRRSADNQSRLVEDLLDVSRMTSGKLVLAVETVDLAGVVSRAVEAATLGAESKSIRLVSVLDADAGPVLGDPQRLLQVISNLLTNAVKFTPKSGTVRVSLRRAGSDAELRVTDSGIGIEPSFLPRVFELFRQEDEGSARTQPGLGLGLAIAKRLVDLHGGRIHAESDGRDRGATFVVRLPLAPAVIASTAEPSGPRSTKSLAGVRVLVIEDDPDGRDLLASIFSDADAEPICVADAHEALARVASIRPDVIVSDVGLPGLDGLEMMRRLRRRSPEECGAVPACALTAYTRSRDRTASLLAGFQAHVSKPVDVEELVTVVASLVRRITPH